jgi:hypothetical protein
MDCAVGWKFHGEQYLQGNLDSIFWALDNYHLPESREASQSLLLQREQLLKSPPDHRLTKGQAAALRESTSVLRRVLREELGAKLVVAIDPGELVVGDNLGDLGLLLGDQVTARLPDPARRDMEEGFRAMGLGHPTCGAFLFLRGIGGVVQAFHKDWTGSVKKIEGDWGELLNDLRVRPPPPPDNLLRSLVFLRNHYRTLLCSSDTVYTREEIDEMLPLAKETLLMMLRLMEDDSE